jgi:glycine betaine/proline transport system permease protein
LVETLVRMTHSICPRCGTPKRRPWRACDTCGLDPAQDEEALVESVYLSIERFEDGDDRRRYGEVLRDLSARIRAGESPEFDAAVLDELRKQRRLVSSVPASAVWGAVFRLFLPVIDHYDAAMQTMAIIFVCAFICVLLGVPIGIAMSRNDRMQRVVIPILDMLQTLPPFVYLIPLIFLFSVTEPKLYGIAIILYAIVPVIRLTDLGIRLVDRDVIEAADAFGMTGRQKLFGVQIPLALPNIMAGVNQTIMMSLAMVVIASLVSAPGLGVLVLRGIRNLELGVGLVAGFGIVMLAIVLDRVTKASLARIDASRAHR